MKLVSYQYQKKSGIGIVEGEHVIPLSDGISMLEVMERGFDVYAKEEPIPLQECQLFSPIDRPRKNILCVGRNYYDHALEMGGEQGVPEELVVFTKASTSIIGHKDTIIVSHNLTNQLDYEGELAVIIGREGKSIPKEKAMEYVFGYTILNDITARDLQKKHGQFFLGKSMDTFCPLGPVIVTKDEIEDPHQLMLETFVNGEKRQSSSTSKMMRKIEELISEISSVLTLERGDVIATGTPAGVGKGFHPPKFLKDGDQVTVKIEKIGELVNNVKFN
ncbi:hypothetical protein Q75_04420 [Bacillus coahuilensis p1.1.43]|uniref:Fumarylacetoacetase-like C-terminal domain-containing protein n=1 Tax=Bacillus coahuilensis p1.1.43 TaxID=1150625 RepID=A0A147KAK6_9BACI|nr:fumarylacetoacetate hydrolase family protein [Bacillus coahuilensis]KUP07750.1 hypothetical protein Q75_04420 [Bacillus coahuilensis p1.1.43]